MNKELYFIRLKLRISLNHKIKLMTTIRIACLNGKILEDKINFLNSRLTKLKGSGNYSN